MGSDKVRITKLAQPTRAGLRWKVHLPGEYFDSGFPDFESARRFVVDWMNGKVR